ncbi:hypothetical protein V865_006901 [Kwoniella europaea PYCC6329]|uniref:F-box domain-containing protein n=1 Tax=Kwoniella europaea PYCC6329 TaxID=1423913 RepID=A0AAX4KRE1_9TREE
MPGYPRFRSLSDLPPEIIHLTLNHLQQSHQLGTLASLQRTDKYHHDLTTPYLFKEIVVNEIELAQLILPVIFGKTIPETCNELTTSGRNMANSLRSGSSKLRKNLSYTEKSTLIQSQFKGNCATPTEGIFTVDLENSEDEEEEEEDDVTATVSDTTLFPRLESISLQVSEKHNSLLQDILTILGLSCHPKSVCVKWMNAHTGRTIGQEGSDMLELIFPFTENPVNLVIHAAEMYFPFTEMGRYESIRLSYRSPFKESTITNPGEFDPLINSSLIMGAVLSAQKAFHMKPKRIVLPSGPDEPIKHAIKVVKSSAKEISIDYFLEKDQSDFKITESHKWIESIQWVYGEEAEKEPPCQVCGSDVGMIGDLVKGNARKDDARDSTSRPTWFREEKINYVNIRGTFDNSLCV